MSGGAGAGAGGVGGAALPCQSVLGGRDEHPAFFWKQQGMVELAGGEATASDL